MIHLCYELREPLVFGRDRGVRANRRQFWTFLQVHAASKGVCTPCSDPLVHRGAEKEVVTRLNKPLYGPQSPQKRFLVA